MHRKITKADIDRRRRHKLLEYPMVEKCIDIGWEFEIEVEVYFDYTPEEAESMYSAGCNEAVDIYAIHRVDNGAELCLLPEFKSELEDEIRVGAHENRSNYDPYDWVR